MNINSIQQGIGNPLLIFRHHHRNTGARLHRVASSTFIEGWQFNIKEEAQKIRADKLKCTQSPAEAHFFLLVGGQVHRQKSESVP